MKKQMTFVLGVFMIFSLAACGTQTEAEENEAEDVAEIPSEEQNAQADRNTDNTEGGRQEDTEMKLQIEAGGSTFTAALEDNEAVNAFVEMMEEGPVEIEMSEYGGFEKVGSLGTSLPASNSQMTTQAGDIASITAARLLCFTVLIHGVIQSWQRWKILRDGKTLLEAEA